MVHDRPDIDNEWQVIDICHKMGGCDPIEDIKTMSVDLALMVRLIVPCQRNVDSQTTNCATN